MLRSKNVFWWGKHNDLIKKQQMVVLCKISVGYKIRTVCVSVTIVFIVLFSLMIIFVDKVSLGVFQYERLSVFSHMNTEQLLLLLYCSDSATICTLDAIVNSLKDMHFAPIWSCLSDVSILFGL